MKHLGKNKTKKPGEMNHVFNFQDQLDQGIGDHDVRSSALEQRDVWGYQARSADVSESDTVVF